MPKLGSVDDTRTMPPVLFSARPVTDVGMKLGRVKLDCGCSRNGKTVVPVDEATEKFDVMTV